MQKRILIFGLPGSGKSTLANKLTKKLDALHINADEVREKFNDWDFSDEGRLRQAYRMKEMSSDVDKQYVILDFVSLIGYAILANKLILWIKANPKVINTISACVLVIIAIIIALTHQY